MINLAEGETYSVTVTVTNESTKAGSPVEVCLGVGIRAVANSTILIPEQIADEYFAPGETRMFGYTLNVPLGSGGQSGSIDAVVQDPAGGIIAQATEAITITVPAYPPGITILEITGERKADGVYAYVKWVWHSHPFDPDAKASAYCELGRMENGVWRNYWTIEPFSGYPPEDTPSVIICRWPEEYIQEMIRHEEIAYGDKMGFRCQVIAWVYWDEIGSSPWVIAEEVVTI